MPRLAVSRGRMGLGGGGGGGRCYYVDSTLGLDTNNGRSPASAWQTVAKVNSAIFNPGDRVLFKRGETWILAASLATVNGITYADYGEGNKPILNGNNAVDVVEILSKSRVALQNLDIRAGLDFGVEVNGSNGITLDGLAVSACGNDNIIFIDGCTNCNATNIISTNPYERVAGPSITCFEIADNCDHITVDNLTATGSAQYGLSIHAHTGHSLSTNVVVRNSTITTAGMQGLQVFMEEGATNPANPSILIDNVSITGCTGKGLNIIKVGVGTIYPAGVTVKNCTIKDNIPAGTLPQVEIHGTNHVFHHNLVIGAAERCMNVSNVANLSVYNNTLHTIAGTAFNGVFLVSGTDNNGITFKNNIVSCATTGVFCIQVTLNCGVGFVSDYNLFYSPSGAAANRWSWYGTNSTWANWKTNSGGDANSPAPADPKYVGAGDYHLQAGSPAIDAGVLIPAVTDGYLGAAPDCGAYETA